MSYQKFAKDVGLVALVNALVALSGFILLPVLTKTLGVRDYGLWVQAQVTIGLAMNIVHLGLPIGLSRFLPAQKDRRIISDNFWSVAFIVLIDGLLVLLLMFILSDLIAESFFEGAADVFKLVAFLVPVWTLDWVCLNYLRAFRHMGIYSIATLFRTYGEVGLVCYAVLAGFGVIGAIASLLIIRFVMLLVLSGIIISRIGLSRPKFSLLKPYFQLGLPTVPGNLSSWTVDSSDRYMMAYFLGTGAVGIYSPGYTLGALLARFLDPLSFILPPTLSKLYDEGKIDEVKTYLSHCLKYILMVAIPFCFGATILSKPLLELLTIPEIAAKGHLVTPFVALSYLLICIYAVTAGQTLLLLRKTNVVAVAWIGAALTNLVLNALLIPRFGILAAAFTTLIAYGLGTGICIYSARSLTFPVDWRSIIKSIIASLLMSGVIWAVNPEGGFEAIGMVVAGVAVYAGALYLLRGFSKQEVRFFIDLIRKRG